MAAPLSSTIRNSSKLMNLRSNFLFHGDSVRKCYFSAYVCHRKLGNVKIANNLPPKIDLYLRYFSGASSHSDRKCWKCGSATDSEKELYFCNCGVVQSVPTDMTYFKAMKCDETFDIDLQQLSRLYKELMRNLHPDKYSQSSKEEQILAEQQSSFINKAYTTLLKPLTRGLYLLEIHNDPIEESNSEVDPEFLMEIMEVNEDIAEVHSDIDSLLKIENINTAKMENCIKEVSKAFKEDNVPSAKQLLVKLKYFSNIDDKIKEIYRHKMDHN